MEPLWWSQFACTSPIGVAGRRKETTLWSSSEPITCQMLGMSTCSRSWRKVTSPHIPKWVCWLSPNLNACTAWRWKRRRLPDTMHSYFRSMRNLVPHFSSGSSLCVIQRNGTRYVWHVSVCEWVWCTVHVAVEVRKWTFYRKLILRKWHVKFSNDFDMIVDVVLDCLLYACKGFNGNSPHLCFMCARRCIV